MIPPDETPVDPAALPEERASLPCWRCGLRVDPSESRCTHCAARLHPQNDVRDTKPKPDESRQLFVVLGGFFAFLLTSILYGIVANVAGDKQPKAFEDGLVIAVETIDAIILLIVWASCGSARLPIATGRYRLRAWLYAGPILAVYLTVNCLYHDAIREYIHIEWLKLPDPPGLTAMSVATTCVQPAIVEEFFFRYLILGVLRRHCGVHGSVHISAAMFAICHVHVLLSMPYLFAAGVFFGYARAASRSMVLPVSLHFIHNLIVTWWEAES